MNYNVLLGYVKQAWKNYLREGNVSTLRWDCEDTEEVVTQRLQQLSSRSGTLHLPMQP